MSRRLVLIKKTRPCCLVDFAAISADHRLKIKESEKIDKYLNLAKELKKLLNISMKVIPIVVGALGRVPEGLKKRLEELEIRGGIKTLQLTALLRSTRRPRRVLENWRDLLLLKFQWTLVWQNHKEKKKE